MNIKDQVISIIADQAFLAPSDVTMNSTLESLGIDSMGIVESIFAIEETFDVSVPFNANQPDTSVGSNFSDTIDRLAKATAISAMAKIAMQR